MKTKLKETRDKSVEDLRKEVTEQQRHLFDLRSQAVTEKLEDPTQLGKTKRHIARIRTILREREIAAMPAKPETPKPKAVKAKLEKKVARRKGRIRAPKKRDRKQPARATK